MKLKNKKLKKQKSTDNNLFKHEPSFPTIQRRL